jgi:hypothetical protein
MKAKLIVLTLSLALVALNGLGFSQLGSSSSSKPSSQYTRLVEIGGGSWFDGH